MQWTASEQLVRTASDRSDHYWNGNNFEIAHYGVDPKLFLDADHAFQEHTGIKQPFVQAGRIEPAKNQAMLCWALRKTDLPVVLVGSKQHWPSYAELCKNILGDRLTIIDPTTKVTRVSIRGR